MNASTSHFIQNHWFMVQLRRVAAYGSVTLFTIMLLAAFLLPLSYSVLTSVKDKQQITDSARGSIFPLDKVKYEFEGKSYDVYLVPMEDGSVRQLALFKAGRSESTFIDPQDPSAESITWQGAWRTLSAVEVLDVGETSKKHGNK